jgi:hypothetical protein
VALAGSGEGLDLDFTLNLMEFVLAFVWAGKIGFEGLA